MAEILSIIKDLQGDLAIAGVFIIIYLYSKWRYSE